MISDPAVMIAVTTASLVGLVVACLAVLRGWNGWLALQRLALERRERDAEPGPMQRIELADLRERVRKLEAIAAGVEL